MTPCDIHGERLCLLPERALWWPAGSVLFVADFHLGKAASFRRAGIPVPETTTDENLERLGRALDRTGALTLVILGDFLHSRDGRSPETFGRFGRWRASRASLSITLVRGNHDDRAGDPPGDWGIDCVDPGTGLGPFGLVHEPAPVRGGYALAGHIHPAVRLTEGSRQSLRLPCFWFGARVGVLPAFGAFTGSVVVRPKRGDQVFVIAEGEVIALGAAPSAPPLLRR